MILIGKPYVSDFLIETIKRNNFKVVATSEAKNLVEDDTLNWISEREAIKAFEEKENIPIYSNSENTIHWINKNPPNSSLVKHLNIFKNKIKFRDLLSEFYPDYFFKGVPSANLDKINANTLKFPLIIKPAVGFFSMSVHKVEDIREWQSILLKIDEEIKINQNIYPKEVVDIEEFIIEEFIEGEEYAIDCYFNQKGEAVVLNIMHHIFSSGKDVSDRVYSTSKKIIETSLNPIEDFLQSLGSKLNLVNFPMHIEIRVTDDKKIIPIEVNPLRFGGWCTTGDLSWNSFGINSYEYFLHQKTPDWNEILNKIEDKVFSIIVLDNNSGIPEDKIDSFDYDQLKNDFSNPLVLRKVNYNEYPVFGFVFIQTTEDDDVEIKQILTSNLKKYITVL